jgi:hypothetical protein
LKTRDFLLATLLAGTAAFFFVVLRKRREHLRLDPYARPDGGDRDGEFELFIGS